MNNGIWVGVSISILSMLVQAAEAESTNSVDFSKLTQCKVSSVVSQGFTSIQVCNDGSRILTRTDGSSIVLPSDLVKQLQALKLNSEFKFDRSKPCYAESL